MIIKKVGQFLIWGNGEITKVIGIISENNQKEYPGTFQGQELAVCANEEGRVCYVEIEPEACAEVKGESTETFPEYRMPQPGDGIWCSRRAGGNTYWVKKTFESFIMHDGSMVCTVKKDNRLYEFPLEIKLIPLGK